MLGTILIEFDFKTDRFFIWKFAPKYCLIVGGIVAVLHPIVHLQFQMTLSSTVSFLSFAIFVSAFHELSFYVSMIISYQQQYANHKKLRDTLNEFAFFYCRSKECASNFNASETVTSYQFYFFASVLIKFLGFVIRFSAYFFLLSKESFRLWFCFLAFPHIISMSICNQYFLGILLVSLLLK